jgi:hypothetical protein
MKRFTTETLLEIRDWLAAALGDPEATAVDFVVVDPAQGSGLHSGEEVLAGSHAARHRGYRCWVELAGLLGCRLVVLRDPLPGADPGFVRLRLERLDPAGSFHDAAPEDPTEKYGTGSPYARIDKLEEPAFALALEAALRRVDLPPVARVLDLGVNTGDELELLRRVCGEPRFATLELVGIDHSRSAIARARERFDGQGRRLLVHDLNALAELDLGRFDLLLSVGTLHSPGIENSKTLLMRLVQEHLTPSGAVILGFPNCRWRDGEVLAGARAPNYNHPELSLVLGDLDWCKRYLSQHRFRVTITGSHYLFVTATRIGTPPRHAG